MNKPFFSVIVPAHNAAGRIRKLLDSIKMQTFDDYEVIIVCDDCQDGTAEIAAEYVDNAFPQGQVLEVGWHNCGKTRNAALELANGEWVLFSDDDDWWREDTAFANFHSERRDCSRHSIPPGEDDSNWCVGHLAKAPNRSSRPVAILPPVAKQSNR